MRDLAAVRMVRVGLGQSGGLAFSVGDDVDEVLSGHVCGDDHRPPIGQQIEHGVRESFESPIHVGAYRSHLGVEIQDGERPGRVPAATSGQGVAGIERFRPVGIGYPEVLAPATDQREGQAVLAQSNDSSTRFNTSS